MDWASRFSTMLTPTRNGTRQSGTHGDERNKRDKNIKTNTEIEEKGDLP